MPDDTPKITPEKRVLTAADLKRIVPRTLKEVPIPELGGVIYVQSLTAKEKADLEVQFTRKSEKDKNVEQRRKEARERWMVASVVDDRGNKILTLADVHELGEQHSAVVTRIADSAMEVNKVTKEDIDEILGN